MRRMNTLEAATLATLLLGVGLALAPEARAGFATNGSNLNGSNLNGERMQGSNLNGERQQGSNLNGRAATDLGALQIQAVRLPDGRILTLGRH